jgi:pyruvate oxidase
MAGEWDVWQTQLHNPNFADFATSCGALGIRVTDKSDLEKSMKKILTHQGTALLEIMTDVKLI